MFSVCRISGLGRFASRALHASAFLALFCASSFYLHAETAQPPEAGQVTVKLEPGYARLVFSFDKRPAYNVNTSVMNSGVFVLRFDQPVDVNINGLSDKLPSYVSAIRRDSDGKSLRFALLRKLRVNTAEAGNELYVDFLPEPWFGAAPALPPEVVAELMREAQEKERLKKEEMERASREINLGHVDVTSSEAPTFTRFGFLWRDKVPTSLQRNGDQLKVVFDRIGDIGLASVQAHLPRFVEDISVDQVDLRTIVTMKVDAMRDVRMFDEGNAVYVDIQGPQRGALEFRADGNIAKSNVPDLAGNENGPKTKIYGDVSEKAAAPEQQQAAAQPENPQNFSMSAPQPDIKPADAAAQDQKPLPVAPSVKPSSVKAAGNASLVTPETATIDGLGMRVIFGFNTETPATIFQRGDMLWLVFSTDEKINTQPIADLFAKKLRRIDVTYQNKLAIVRMQLDAPLLISASALDMNWTLTFGDTIAELSEPAELKAHIAPDGRSIVNGYMSRAVGIEKLHDPVAGDDITIVLAMPPAIGMIKPQQFVDFSSLATLQGAALVLNSDDLTFRLDDIGFVIERPGSMAVSIASSPRASQISSQQVQSTFGYIDFEGWKLGPVDEFNKIKSELINRAGTSEGSARNAVRLDLARFYLSYENGQEALALLNLVVSDDPAAERELSFRVIRGVANVMSGRFESALRDFSDPLLDDNLDVSIWRGLAAAQKGDWKIARRDLEKAQAVTVNYPRTLQAKVLLTLARATIELNDLVNTDAVLDEASNTLSTDGDKAELTLLRGLFNEAVGRYDAAINFYKQIDQTRHTKSGAEAMLRMVSLQEKLGQLPDEQAIPALEALAFTWRGDTLELQTYQRLGALYVKNDQFRMAFDAMRNATLANADAEISRQLYDDMRIVFTSLYLDGKADKMPAVDALSLFYDFRELTPAGRLGDEIIRTLAERLVEVDLLDQSIDLLAYQVQNRLTGMMRAEVGTELALVHLMNKEPQKALSVLHRTRQTSMPADLEKQRTLIEARALAGTGRPELATELLSADTPENLRLRTDILWEGKDWKGAAASFEKLLGDRWQKDVVLTDQERNDILRGAVAFALADDMDGVKRFRSKFTRAMSDTTEAHMFDVATGPVDSQGAEFRTLVRNLASVDNLESFWQTYREKYGRNAKKEPQANIAPAAATEKKNPA
ncbi:MAG: hypothetical protein V4691_05695 [Pseudomonadota bacterium]